ncbi:MAG: hypothetical protein U5R48_14850 [Gammaproteobacteria bacterium]|nr:hypothetical protein [Gammaproteobacteria bacterium]
MTSGRVAQSFLSALDGSFTTLEIGYATGQDGATADQTGRITFNDGDTPISVTRP